MEFFNGELTSVTLQTDFYHSNSVFQDGKIIYTLFSETNNVRHAQMKRPIAQLYSQNGLRDLEPHINNTISYFIQRLDQEFIMGRNKDGICDLAIWLSYCMPHSGLPIGDRSC